MLDRRGRGSHANVALRRLAVDNRKLDDDRIYGLVKVTYNKISAAQS